MHRIPKSDAFVIIIVSSLTVIFDLAIAVISGIIISAICYVWKSSTHINAESKLNKNKTEKTYKLFGPLFFGSIDSFNQIFSPKNDPKNIIIDFNNSRVWDHSALEALKKIAKKYQKLNKNITYKGLSKDCASLLSKSGCNIVKNDIRDPNYEVIIDHS